MTMDVIYRAFSLGLLLDAALFGAVGYQQPAQLFLALTLVCWLMSLAHRSPAPLPPVPLIKENP